MKRDHAPFYSNEKIEQKLDLIHHMLQFGDELLLVTGEKGVGKSCQLQELMRRLGEGWQICYLTGSENRQISQLFEKISHSFGYDYSKVPSAELLSGFKSHLELKESGKTYALLVDDAEQLDEGALEAITHLSQLKSGNDRLLRVVLFGTELLRDTPILKTIPLREVTIEPLDSEQSQAFIDFCIEQGRHEFGKPPSIPLQQQVVNSAMGIPGEIEAMLRGGSVSKSGWSILFDWRIAAAMLLIVAVGVGYLLNTDSGPLISPPVTAQLTSPDSQRPVIRKALPEPAKPRPELKTESIQLEEDSEATLIGDLLKQSGPHEQEIVIPVETISTAAEPDSEMAAEDSNERLTPAVVEDDEAAMLNEDVPMSLQEAPQTTPPAEVKKQQEVGGENLSGRAWLQSQPETSFTIQLVAAEREAALDEMILKEKLHNELVRFSFSRGGRPIHVLTQGIYSERTSAEEALKRYSSAVKPWIRPIGDIQQLFVDNPPPVMESSVVAVEAEPEVVKDSAWLWSQDPELITIQLVAGGDRGMLEPFVNDSLKLGTTAVLESKRDSKPWFILLHGSYKTRDEARKRIRALPQKLKTANPWVRSFASVHDELSRAN
ncbi:MAG: AAA family ATPase [Gammaproteobacteria bacterium]|nr:AAA family ATPase [Gammaproteobacteria bacterium]